MSLDLLQKRELLDQQIKEAAKPIAPLWPLSTAITVNPLWDLRNMGFREAILHARKIFGISGYPSREIMTQAYMDGRINDEDIKSACGVAMGGLELIEALVVEKPDTTILTVAESHDLLYGTNTAIITDREVAKWCAAYIYDVLPDTQGDGFYRAWRNIVAVDPAFRRLFGKSARKRLTDLPEEPIDAILESLTKLGVDGEETVQEMSRQFARMPGWAGYAKWCSVWHNDGPVKSTLSLVDYLAVRLAYDVEILTTHLSDAFPSLEVRSKISEVQAAKDTRDSRISQDIAYSIKSLYENKNINFTLEETQEALLRAYENHYRDHLLSILSAPRKRAEKVTPTVQAIFCIDVRSERIRRHLEKIGPYETFGFAGFFGLPISFRAWGTEETVSLCPVFAHPDVMVTEKPIEVAYQTALRQLSGMQALSAADNSFSAIRKGSIASFFGAEISGFFMGPATAAKTLFPSTYAGVKQWLNQKFAPDSAKVIDMSPHETGMSVEDQVLFAESLLLSISLTSDFAEIVLLCGHGSTTENNPYASMLDCGACGAKRGGVSARAATAVLNRSEVRTLLGEKGIVIPEETLFVAAEHDTVTDRVEILDPHLIPVTHLDKLALLRHDLKVAAQLAVAERIATLPGYSKKNPLRESVSRSYDWAEIRPEWGAARNAAFIIAPRTLTAGVDLEGRCFLHSYETSNDTGGTMLESILSGPVAVAHWINAQYYFSTVDAEQFSAGDKTVHNIMAGIGVTEGDGFDLKVGLPLQSLFYNGNAYHEPMRLLVLVEASKTLLDKIISRNELLAELFDGEWMHLVARDVESENWVIRYSEGRWKFWKS